MEGDHKMNVDLGIWRKLTRLVLFLLFIAALLTAIVLYTPLIRQNEGMRREVVRLENKNKEAEEKSKRLKAEIEAIRTDPKTVERLARERMSYAKTNETVIRFEPAPLK